ncbi:MAG: Bifunctional polymyxin resistance protein ArnA [Chlamydiae bacterium]|nr:Bifunctional polymyxin resistance protein ArnA [Chlamydiota bacterium]
MEKHPIHFSNIAILTTEGCWFEPFARELVEKIAALGYHAALFFDAKEISDSYEVVFMLSYYQLVRKEDLAKRKHNIVIHPSDLPEGKGWAPLAWQLLEGKDEISIVLFEAEEAVDSGPIYLKETLSFDGSELHDEIRERQGEKLIEMSLKFLTHYDSIKGIPQGGRSTFYQRRTPKDSELDIHKTLAEQMNLLRICHNEEYPPFFYHLGKKYILNVFKEERML